MRMRVVEAWRSLSSCVSAPALTAVGMTIVTIAFGVLGWQHRWLGDDGLIVTRTVRQILEGNGPVYSVFERAEANTSTLWTYLCVVGGLFSDNIPRVTVMLGLALATLAVLVGMDATRRFHAGRDAGTLLAPAGVLVVLAVSPFWDYATSGLETGLCLCWIAVIWWLLVTLEPTGRRRGHYLTVVVFGLGPLVRPDFGLISIVFLVAAWAILRPSWRRALSLGAVAVALPLCYEIFRAGYYGILVPLPALAKSAADAEWARGLDYLLDFTRSYLLWLPALVIVTVFGIAVRCGRIAGRGRIVAGAPIVAAALMSTYVLRVGGDFMHARMWLPATLLFVLPVFLLPIRKLTVPALAGLGAWAIATCGDRQAPHPSIVDERAGYLRHTRRDHPIDAAPFLKAARPVPSLVADAARWPRRLLVTEAGRALPMNPAHDAPVAFAVGRLGLGGVAAPLDGIVVDTLGLANPLGARITVTNPDAVGHEKPLPWAWVLADFADPSLQPVDGPPIALVNAARRAMTCGELAELLASVREPMSPRRFWDNLTGSLRRTRLVIPADPLDAEQRFCGSIESVTARVTASSSYESSGWSALNVVDRATSSVEGQLGYSSGPWRFENHPEWIELQLAAPRVIQSVVVHPSNRGAGFPIDFTIETWEGGAWVPRITRRGEPPPIAAQTYVLEPTTTDRVRLHATRLSVVGTDGHLLQLAEIELRSP